MQQDYNYIWVLILIYMLLCYKSNFQNNNRAIRNLNNSCNSCNPCNLLNPFNSCFII